MSDMLGFDARLLFSFGGNLAPALEAGDYWRLLTASFLHGGIIHLGFNLFALAVVGPQVEALYGRLQMLFLFVATGVVAFAGSAWAGPPVVAIGASGGLMGLVGVAAGWGHREGTGHGRALRNDMIKWSAYVFVFGFFINADNWAHLFGLLSGLAIGYAVRPGTWKLRVLMPLRAAAGACGVVGAIVALVIIARQPVDLDEVDAPPARRLARHLQPLAEICRLHWQGDQAGAIARAGELTGDAGPVPPEQIGPLCDDFIRIREQCRSGAAPPPDFGGTGGDALHRWRATCDALEIIVPSAPEPPAGQ
jgi:rhomboid protease GluP